MNHITCMHCRDTYPDFDVAHVCSKGPYAPRLKPKMNERIRLLAEQAGFIDRGSNHTAYMSFDHEKFAELIVRDCLAQVARVDDMLEDEPAQTAAVAWAGSAIAEHFGVEE